MGPSSPKRARQSLLSDQGARKARRRTASWLPHMCSGRQMSHRLQSITVPVQDLLQPANHRGYVKMPKTRPPTGRGLVGFADPSVNLQNREEQVTDLVEILFPCTRRDRTTHA